jgi:hypothetical protein
MTEPYFGTPNEPYESPPDRPFESPDRPFESPPVQPYQPPPVQPPPVQPYQPPPDRPRKPRQSRRWWISGAAVIVLVGVTVLLILASTGGSSRSSSSSDPGYGRSAVDVVHELRICDNPQVDQGIATCTLQDGIGFATVVTMADKTEQDVFAAGAKTPPTGAAWLSRATSSQGPTAPRSHGRSAISMRSPLNITATWRAAAVSDHHGESDGTA